MGNLVQEIYRSDESLQRDQDLAFLRHKAGRFLPENPVKKEALPHTDMIRPRPFAKPEQEAQGWTWEQFEQWIGKKKPILTLRFSDHRKEYRAEAGAIRVLVRPYKQTGGFKAEVMLKTESGNWEFFSKGFSDPDSPEGTPEQAVRDALRRGFFTDGFSWRPLTDVVRIYMEFEGIRRSPLQIGRKSVVWEALPIGGWWPELPMRTWWESRREKPVKPESPSIPHAMKPLPEGWQWSEYKPDLEKERQSQIEGDRATISAFGRGAIPPFRKKVESFARS